MNKPIFLIAALLGGCATQAPVVQDPAIQHLVPPAAAADTPPPTQRAPAATLEQGIWRPNQPPVLAMQAPRQMERAAPQMSPLEPPPYAPGYVSQHRFYPPLYYTPGIPPPPPPPERSAPFGGPLMGGIIGAVIGSQFGQGDGRALGAALGASAGALYGNAAEDPCQPGISGGTLVGAALGGVIGNQFGAGSGRTALTAIGAATGAIAGTRAGGTSPCR